MLSLKRPNSPTPAQNAAEHDRWLLSDAKKYAELVDDYKFWINENCRDWSYRSQLNFEFRKNIRKYRIDELNLIQKKAIELNIEFALDEDFVFDLICQPCNACENVSENGNNVQRIDTVDGFIYYNCTSYCGECTIRIGEKRNMIRNNDVEPIKKLKIT